MLVILSGQGMVNQSSFLVCVCALSQPTHWCDTGGWAHLAETLREDFTPQEAQEQMIAHASSTGREGSNGVHLAPQM